MFAIVRNEIDIIEDWLRWNLNLVGNGNIYILENMSDDGTYEILEKYQTQGKVHIERTTCNYFVEKKGIMNRLINEHRDCDLVVPIDADEFIVGQKDGQILYEKNEILDLFAALPIEEYGAFKFGRIESCCHKPEVTDPLVELTMFRQRTSKEWGELAQTFCAAKTFVRLKSAGHHRAVTSSKNQSYYYSNIGFLHFSNRGYAHFEKKALWHADLFKDPSVQNVVREKFLGYKESYLKGTLREEFIAFNEQYRQNFVNVDSDVFADKILELRRTNAV